MAVAETVLRFTDKKEQECLENKFLKVKMEPTKSGIGGSFITTASFKLDNIISPGGNGLFG